MNQVVLTGGTVLTCDAGDSVAEAIALDGGRILCTGSTEDVLAAAGPGARTVDLDGATVIPGLIDTHPHVMHFGMFSVPAGRSLRRRRPRRHRGSDRRQRPRGLPPGTG